jgi:hypothetical protein
MEQAERRLSACENPADASQSRLRNPIGYCELRTLAAVVRHFADSKSGWGDGGTRSSCASATATAS